MKIEYLTLAMQLVILVAAAVTVRAVHIAAKAVRALTKLIEQYRGEIAWLTARIEALEGKLNGQRRSENSR